MIHREIRQTEFWWLTGTADNDTKVPFNLYECPKNIHPFLGPLNRLPPLRSPPHSQVEDHPGRNPRSRPKSGVARSNQRHMRHTPTKESYLFYCQYETIAPVFGTKSHAFLTKSGAHTCSCICNPCSSLECSMGSDLSKCNTECIGAPFSYTLRLILSLLLVFTSRDANMALQNATNSIIRHFDIKSLSNRPPDHKS